MRWLRGAVMLCLCCMILCLGLWPERCMSAAADALTLCASSVIPSLFPFFVASNLLVALGGAEICGRALSGVMQPAFRVDGSGALAVVLGVVSGYPVGAGCAAELYNSGRISKTEAERLLCFCNNSGPLFIIGTVGAAMSGSARVGGILYMIHIAAALLAGFVTARLVRGDEEVINPRLVKNRHAAAKLADALGGSVAKSVTTILNVCGFVVFFAVAESILPRFRGHEFLSCLLEITGGIAEVSEMSMAPGIKFPLISMFLALSGLSVFFQTASIISGSGLSMKYYALGKAVQAAFALSLTFAASPLLSGGFAGAFLADSGQLSEYSMYLYTLPPLDIKRYLILVGGEILWCALIIGGLWLASKILPDKD